MKRLAMLAAGLLTPCTALFAQDYSVADLAKDFSSTVIVIEANEYACYRFDAFVANNDAQRQRGLMFVRNLPQQTGMLFLYKESAMHAMWMKNTYIPLDILFIRGNGVISSVARHTEPLSERSIRSNEPVNYVLELNAGVTERLFIDSDSILKLD
jgi:uncharacterized protein